MKFICHVCGCDKLTEAPYDSSGIGTWEMCPCCGFESGMFCENSKSIDVFSKARADWIKKGAPWTSPLIPSENNWNYKEQLKNLSTIGILYEDN